MFLLLVVEIKVAIGAPSLGIDHSVFVRALRRKTLPPVCVVAVVAHALGIVLHLRVGAPGDRAARSVSPALFPRLPRDRLWFFLLRLFLYHLENRWDCIFHPLLVHQIVKKLIPVVFQLFGALFLLENLKVRF